MFTLSFAYTYKLNSKSLTQSTYQHSLTVEPHANDNAVYHMKLIWFKSQSERRLVWRKCPLLRT